jgi:hypothetical protein
MDRPALDASTAIAALTAGDEVSPTLLERLKPKSKRKA